MEYSVQLLGSIWVVFCWNAEDKIVWGMVCRNRRQAEKIATAYSSGKCLYVVVSSVGNVHQVFGTCSRERDIKRIKRGKAWGIVGNAVTVFYTLSMAI